MGGFITFYVVVMLPLLHWDQILMEKNAKTAELNIAMTRFQFSNVSTFYSFSNL